MEPAQSIIKKLGGPDKVADICGVHRTRVFAWKRKKVERGTGGVIPMKHIPVLLAHAASSGVDLSASDFIPPADAA